MPERSDNDRPRVLMVGPTPPPIGGIATQVRLLLSSPLVRSFSVIHLNPDVPVAAAGSRPPVVRRMLASLRLVAHFLRTLHTTRVKLVHVHASSFPGFYEKALLAAMGKAIGRKAVLHLHGGAFERSWQHSRAKWAIRWFLSRPDAIVVPARRWADVIAQASPAASVEMVPNSVAVRLYYPPLPRDDRMLRILFVGWMIREKGIFDLLEAIARMGAGLSSFEVHMVGDGRDMAQFKNAVAARNLSGVFKLHGWQDGDEKLRSFRTADLFVLPSHVEAFGVVLLEAMAAGLPVVATRVGGIPEIVTHRVQGELVERGDVRMLASTLERLCRDPQLREQYGQAALERVRAEYDIERGAERVAAIYHRLLGES